MEVVPENNSLEDFVTSGNIIDSLGGISDVTEAYDKYTTDGFFVKKIGDYAIIKGARSESAIEEGIEGTRYAIKNAKKYSNVMKYVKKSTAIKEAFKSRSNIALATVGIIVDTTKDVFKDINKGAGGTKIAADVTVDVVTGVGNAAAGLALGAAIGTAIPVPVVGTLVGAAVGFAVGYIADKLEHKDAIKKWTKSIFDKIF